MHELTNIPKAFAVVRSLCVLFKATIYTHGISIVYRTFFNQVFCVILFLETIDMFTQEVISDVIVNNLLADLNCTI